jgi:predicted PurR-regulated permease PerM
MKLFICYIKIITKLTLCFFIAISGIFTAAHLAELSEKIFKSETVGTCTFVFAAVVLTAAFTSMISFLEGEQQWN